MRVLVTRPEPAASITAAALDTLGHQAVVVPLLTIESLRWAAPETLPQALLITSANAVRHAGDDALAYRTLPAFAVGATTAAALRQAGFADVRIAGNPGLLVAVLAAARAAGVETLLHLAGANRTRAQLPAGMTVEVRTVYQARRAQSLPDAVRDTLDSAQIDAVLLYSARTAATFAALCDRAGVARHTLHIATLSGKVAAAAGQGWARVSIAARPDESALFAAAGLVCDKGLRTAGASGEAKMPSKG